MGYIKQAWLVLVLAVVFGSALAGVHIVLQSRIDENKLNETYSQIPNLSRSGDKIAETSRTQEFVSADGKIAYKTFTADGEHIGWVIKADGQGFADRIELLIGLDASAGTITGLYVLDQKETPGVGNKIEDNNWRNQFVGKKTDEKLTVTKAAPGTGSEIQAISGATISSQSVCDIVNKAVAEFRGGKSGLMQKEKKD